MVKKRTYAEKFDGEWKKAVGRLKFSGVDLGKIRIAGPEGDPEGRPGTGREGRRT